MWYSYKWIWERGFFCLFFSILLRWENLGLRVREVAFKTKNDLFMELISAGNIWQMCPDKSCSKENRSWSTSVIYSQPKARLFTHFVKLVSYKADLVQALMAEVCDAIADYIFMIWGDGILMLPPKKKKKKHLVSIYSWIYVHLLHTIRSSFSSGGPGFSSSSGPDGLLTFISDFLSPRMSARSVQRRADFSERGQRGHWVIPPV